MKETLMPLNGGWHGNSSSIRGRSSFKENTSNGLKSPNYLNSKYHGLSLQIVKHFLTNFPKRPLEQNIRSVVKHGREFVSKASAIYENFITPKAF